MAKKPPTYGRGLVGGGVVHDHVDVQLRRDVLVDQVQEPAELLGPVPGGEIGDDVAGGNIEGGVQVGDAVPDVVVGLALRDARPKGQDRCGAVQGLDLALLVYAQHDRRIGWVQVQADDVPDLVDELGVGGELEVLGA